MWTSDRALHPIITGALFLGTACGTPAPEPTPTPASEPVVPTEGAPLVLHEVEDNLRHDTLLVQVTFDLGDGTHLMVASHVDEKFEGPRIYHYRARPDSSAEVMHVSPPGYDSWTMLPTVFGEGAGLEGKWVLANFGERESWGQKVMWFANGFQERGFMHVALPEPAEQDAERPWKLRNVAPHMRLIQHGDTAVFHFACDTVFVYDDGTGGTDLLVPGTAVRYTWHPAQGLVLWLHGVAHAVPPPA
jgi:hypothetical protein